MGAHRRHTLLGGGVSAAELRGNLWRQPLHGSYALAMSDPCDPMQRIADAASVLPAPGALSGWASAFVQGVGDLDGRRWDGSFLPVLMALPPQRQVRRHGISTIRAPLPDSDLIEVGELIITAPGRSCFDMMRLSSLEDAVVGVDAMLRAKVVSIEKLDDYLAKHAGWKGAPTVRSGLELCDGRAASCPESRLRVLWVVEAHGLTVVRSTSIDLMHRRRQTVARLRDGYRRALRRDRRLDRWTLDLHDPLCVSCTTRRACRTTCEQLIMKWVATRAI